MGNEVSLKKRAGVDSNALTSSADSKSEEDLEIGLLEKTFKQMALRSPNETISKETFVSIFNLPGILGERLFDIFDSKKTGVIDFEEFLSQYRIFSTSDPISKMDMIFNLFDLDGEGAIDRDELRTVLFLITIPPNQAVSNPPPPNASNAPNPANLFNPPNSNIPTPPNHTVQTPNKPNNSNNSNHSRATSLTNLANLYVTSQSNTSSAATVDVAYISSCIDEIVSQAFKECDTDATGSLDCEQFRNFMRSNPDMIELCEALFIQLAWNNASIQSESIRRDFNLIRAELGAQSYTSPPLQNLLDVPQCDRKSCKMRFLPHDTIALGSKNTSQERVDVVNELYPSEDGWKYVVLAQGDLSVANQTSFRFCPNCGHKLSFVTGGSKNTSRSVSRRSSSNSDSIARSIRRRGSTQTFEQFEDEKFDETKSGNSGNSGSSGSSELNDCSTYKSGRLRVENAGSYLPQSVFCVLHGQFVYVFKNAETEWPDKIHFIRGYYVTLVKNDESNNNEIKYADLHLILLIPPAGSRYLRVLKFYLSDLQQARDWVQLLRRAAETESIFKYYHVTSRVLGQGAFATVRLGYPKKGVELTSLSALRKAVAAGPAGSAGANAADAANAVDAVDQSVGNSNGELAHAVAVKIIDKHAADSGQLEAVRLELSIMKLLNHENVVSLLHVFETRNKMYVIMPYYRGGDLYDYVAASMQNKVQDEMIREQEIRHVLWQVLNALEYLHALGIVHRDIKLQNLLLKSEYKDEQGNFMTPKQEERMLGRKLDVVIADFGLAKFAAPHQKMRVQAGSLDYMAPEIVRGGGYNKQVDLWSVGVLLYALVTLSMPFHADTMEKIIKNILHIKVDNVLAESQEKHANRWKLVGEECTDLMAKLMVKDPKQRITGKKALLHKFFDPMRMDSVKSGDSFAL